MKYVTIIIIDSETMDYWPYFGIIESITRVISIVNELLAIFYYFDYFETSPSSLNVLQKKLF